MKTTIVIFAINALLIPFITSSHSYKAPLPQPTIFKGIVSAYNAEEAQTDDSPFTMASNKRVYEGAVANNCLDFGTEVEIDGEIFVVEDRMNRRYTCEYFDLFKWSKEEALEFGRQEIAILIYGTK